MTEEQVAETIARCEEALRTGGPVDLRALGYWRAVHAVKRHPDWVPRFAEALGQIDRQAFERRVWPVLPVWMGALILSAGTLAGLMLAALVGALPRRWKGPALLASTGALLVSTHGLAHLIVGRMLGMRFVGWFLGGPIPIEPGIKIDQASYLRVPACQRAWMHASGAIVSKVIPFAMLGLGRCAKAPTWSLRILGGIGIVLLLIDALFSTRFSDWSRFMREMRIARRTT